MDTALGKELYLSFLSDNLNKVLTEFTVSETFFPSILSDFEGIKTKNNSKKTGYTINCEIKTATLGIFTST